MIHLGYHVQSQRTAGDEQKKVASLSEASLVSWEYDGNFLVFFCHNVTQPYGFCPMIPTRVRLKSLILRAMSIDPQQGSPHRRRNPGMLTTFHRWLSSKTWRFPIGHGGTPVIIPFFFGDFPMENFNHPAGAAPIAGKHHPAVRCGGRFPSRSVGQVRKPTSLNKKLIVF